MPVFGAAVVSPRLRKSSGKRFHHCLNGVIRSKIRRISSGMTETAARRV
jgi:hypothetical protein